MHRQQYWLYWTVQNLTRYIYHHVQPAELTVLGCTVSDTLHLSSCTASRTDWTVRYLTCYIYHHAHPAELTVLDCTVSVTLHLSSCTRSRTHCTGLYSVCHATSIVMHTQHNWLYWTVQCLLRYIYHHAHPAELTVLYCTVSVTLHLSSCTTSRTHCTGLYIVCHATSIIMHTQQNSLYWTVQCLSRYIYHHAQPAELTVRGCTVSVTLRRMGWVLHVAQIRAIKMRRNIVGETKGKRQLGWSRCRWVSGVWG